MSGKKLSFIGALGAGLAAVVLAHAADVPQLNVKLGLWEIATHPQVNGRLADNGRATGQTAAGSTSQVPSGDAGGGRARSATASIQGVHDGGEALTRV